MQTIYEPKGKAREYAELALNLYRGCDHGCLYCYAPQILKMDRAEYHNPIERRDVLQGIRNVAERFSGKDVFLCFTTDPYQHFDVEQQITRETIKILHSADISVRILTKGGRRSERDFDLLGGNDAYGATLTFLNPMVCSLHGWEPNAAFPQERIDALRKAYNLGIHTWLSLEPVINPSETLEIIRHTHEFVNEYKVGRWNYDTRANKIDWVKFYRDVTDLLKSTGRKYYIKEDLRKYA